MRGKGDIIGEEVKKKGYLVRARDYYTEHKYSILTHIASVVCFTKGTYDIFVEKDVDTGLTEYLAGIGILLGEDYVENKQIKPRKRRKVVNTIKNRHPDAALWQTIEELREQAPGLFEENKEYNTLKFILKQSDDFEKFKADFKNIFDGKYGTNLSVDDYMNLLFASNGEEGILETIESKKEFLTGMLEMYHPIFELRDIAKK